MTMILPLFIPISVTFNVSPHFLIFSNQLILNSSCICIFICCISVFSNFMDYIFSGFDDGLSGPSLMYLFFTGLILFAFVNIVGVFRQKPIIHYFSFFIWLLLIIFWFAIVALLYADWFMVPELCINHRCPDSFWLNDWYWRSRKIIDNATVSSIQEVSGLDGFHLEGNSTSTKPRIHINIWYSLGSIAICFSFIIYLALLGSLIWNHCNAVCAMRRADEGTPVIPGGYLYVVELRR